MRAMATEALSRYGYALLSAKDGADALELCDGFEGDIALAVIDVVMPGMSGRDLADELASRRPATRVLFTSGYAEDVIAHHGVLDEGVSFLPKPYVPDSLAAKVRKVLDSTIVSSST